MSCLENTSQFHSHYKQCLSLWLHVFIASYSDNSISSDEDDGISPREKEQVILQALNFDKISIQDTFSSHFRLKHSQAFTSINDINTNGMILLCKIFLWVIK